MKKDKKSFIMYCDWIDTFSQLDDEIAGKLIKHIFSYVNDEDPETDNFIVNLAFTPIKQSLKRDLKKYIGIKEDRKRAGRIGNIKRYNPDIYELLSTGKIDLEKAEEIAELRKKNNCNKCTGDSRTCEICDRKRSQTLANLAVNVNVNDSVNVNDNVNVIVKEKQEKEKDPSADSTDSDFDKRIIAQNGILENQEIGELLKSEKYASWRSLTCKQKEISITLLPTLIDEFLIHCSLQGTPSQKTKEAQIWFSRWIDKIPKDRKILDTDPNTPPDNSGNWVFHSEKWINTKKLTKAQKRRLGIE